MSLTEVKSVIRSIAKGYTHVAVHKKVQKIVKRLETKQVDVPVEPFEESAEKTTGEPTESTEQ